jgi:hypothetical protein
MKYTAMFKRPLRSDEGRDGKTYGDWWLMGIFDTRQAARKALSGMPTTWRKRIIEK